MRAGSGVRRPPSPFLGARLSAGGAGRAVVVAAQLVLLFLLARGCCSKPRPIGEYDDSEPGSPPRRSHAYDPSITSDEDFHRHASRPALRLRTISSSYFVSCSPCRGAGAAPRMPTSRWLRSCGRQSTRRGRRSSGTAEGGGRLVCEEIGSVRLAYSTHLHHHTMTIVFWRSPLCLFFSRHSTQISMICHLLASSCSVDGEAAAVLACY